MSLIPEFELGLWNAWILIVLYLLVNFGLPFLLVKRKSAFWAWPSYTRLERICLATGVVLMSGLWIYSIFLPLSLGTAWFYAGLSVYLLGLAFVAIAILTFIATLVDEPNTTGIYRISRHPLYLGLFVVYVGIGIASASWVYLLIALALLATYRTAFVIPEERWCLEKYGDAYREYRNRTPRWIGIPKSSKNRRED